MNKLKIAIVEDRIGRLQHFDEFNLLKCEEVSIITGEDFDKLIIDLEANNTTQLDRYICIASHRSALAIGIRDLLKEYCKLNKKPLIFFSGGISSSVFNDVEFPFLHLNSKDFYSPNLQLLIKDFQHYHIVNPLILQFGTRWKLNLLLNLRNNIAVALNNATLKRVSDLKMNSLLKQDLLNKETELLLTQDEFTSITIDQVIALKATINNLINNSL